jgi:RimJ/RimL family protein N-acetyltransferase
VVRPEAGGAKGAALSQDPVIADERSPQEGGLHRPPVTIRHEGLTSPTARALIGALNAELSAEYSEPGATHFALDPGEVAPGRGAFLVAWCGGEPIGCGAVRLLDAATAELKRMYVAPGLRRAGIGRSLLGALETEARRLGAARVVLETGVRQAAALALYARGGYGPIPLYGEYCLSPDTSICLGKSLGPPAASPRSIDTARLELVPATPALVRAALRGARELGMELAAEVPQSWPPDFLDDAALEATLARLEEDPGRGDWWMYFVVLRDGAARALIGAGGYKGPPSADGTVEVGYAIVRDRRRQGFATEMLRGLLCRAFADGSVRRVIGETFPDLAPSIGVMRRCGFRPAGAGSEPGVIRFELAREAHAAGVRAG